MRLLARLPWLFLACTLAALPARAADPVPAGIDDLPVVAVPPARGGSGRMVVLVSGEGGWAGLVRTISATLAADGIGVAGLDSLKYFWNKRTPEQTTRDIERIAAYYARAWHADRVAYIGYSFGADVLPVVLNRMSPGERARVDGLTLIAPSSVANFEFHFTDWLGASHPGLPTVPEIERLRGLRMVCIYGEGDSDAICPSLAPGLARVAVLDGGHHFDGDFQAVARLVMP